MNLIAALSALSVVVGATASGAADHPSLRHNIRSLGADACAMDVKECEDGSFLNRDPDNNCEFALCPEEELACTMDVFDCGNDTFASRDPAKNCEFEACPKECTGEDGETYMAPCEGIDGMFCIGESYTALDGCNTCTCGNMDGLAACTTMFCPEENVAPNGQDMDRKTCLVNGLEINAGESYVASDGCNVSDMILCLFLFSLILLRIVTFFSYSHPIIFPYYIIYLYVCRPALVPILEFLPVP